MNTLNRYGESNPRRENALREQGADETGLDNVANSTLGRGESQRGRR